MKNISSIITAQKSKYEDLKVLNIIKKKCTDLSTLLNERRQSVRDIYFAVLADYPNLKKTLGERFYKHERALQLIRNKALPENPQSADDIAKVFAREDVMNLLGKAKDGTVFYNGAVECEDFSFCVFSSESSIRLYALRVKPLDRVMMMDGTFDVVPIGPFNQLLIIHVVYMGKVRKNNFDSISVVQSN